MSDLYLWLTPLLALGVLALGWFVGCDALFRIDHVDEVPVVQNVVDFAIDQTNPPMPRTDYVGWAGMVIQPNSDVTLVKLGRWCSPMSTQAHEVKVVDAATGMDVAGAIVVVPLAGQTEFTFVFVDLPTPVTLMGGNQYYLMSREEVGGDGFLDYMIAVTPSADFQVLSAVYGDPTASLPYSTIGAAGNCYGPVNAQY